MKLRFLVTICVLGGCTALPAVATGATVSVTESGGSPNLARLDFQADPAEANRLTATVVGESGEFFTLRLLDEAAAIQPGPGCSGGGAVGVAVDCQVRKPAVPTPSSACTKLGCLPSPGTGWRVELHIELGDHVDHFDASIPDPVSSANGTPRRIALTVVPGAGEDEVIVDGGDNVIESSPGADRIRTGLGDDTLRGGTAPDGADEVDLGAGRNQADYRERSATVIYKANDLADDGGLGEGDKLLEVQVLQGGSGDDLLEGGGLPVPRSVDESLVGGPGADLILGGPGNDDLRGGPGNDLVFGQDGEDHVLELLDPAEAPLSGNDILDGGSGPDVISGSYGDDRVSGGDDHDRIELGPGNDQADAGAGTDLVRGEDGDDTIRGGAGDDRLVGDGGLDALYGDWGADRLLAGVVVTRLWERSFLYSGGPLEGAPDTVDCGPGSGDAVGIDRTDNRKGCETAVRLTRLELLPGTFGSRDVTQVIYEARVPGSVSLSGRGVRFQRHRDMAEGQEDGSVLLVKPAGKALRTLRRHGRVRVRVTVTLRPDTGGKVVRHRWVRIDR